MDADGVIVADARPTAIVRGGFDVIHVHWPDYFINVPSRIHATWRLFAFMALILIARWRGAKVVWTIHNLSAHESRHPILESWMWRWFGQHLDGYTALTEGGRRAGLERHPALTRLPGRVVPLGDYRGEYLDDLGRDEARKQLGIGPAMPTVLFFGIIRDYKNVPHLMDVFRQVEERDWRLVIVGNPATDELRYSIQERALQDDRVQVHLRFVLDEEVQVFMRAADLVVLPFKEILNSSSALLAVSFGVPVLVPDRGTMPELVELAGASLARTYADELTADDLAGALVWAQQTEKRPKPALESLSWQRIAAETVDLYRDIIAVKGHR
jgi:glycosyltransferase involved in cell wall biosynthesis